MNKNAFTMIELVFVIVVLGILSAIAIPKFAATRTDAQISKGRADISSLRSAIMTERQGRLITGDSKYIKVGTNAGEIDNGSLFGGVLTYGIKDSASSGHWTNTGGYSDENTTTYDYQIGDTTVGFTYTRGTGVFDCTTQSDTYCSELTD
ncbi:prepilin-type N-terminal cleavage/methylation domain-containing protein [Sulfurimonas sp. SAG-AH-194-C20]|nr:type II secretion system protein [Sulfurimonas sp. SAG-AH-194-C20]MDF1878230.1 prepilin-type N-terminal cleavage/methylation domain-containing protein [Sulfurimonas sp. SAG-AH-194-C20]